MQDNYSEANVSKNPGIELLKRLGAYYIGAKECNKQRGSQYKVLLKDILRKQLVKMNKVVYAGIEREFS